MPTIACICGTSRPGNYTAHAVSLVMDELVELAFDPVLIDARDLSLPFPGQPSTPDSEQLRTSVAEAAAVVLATPEYHGTFSAMTKLIIESLGFPSVLAGKPVALLGVAAGRIGAVKSIEHLRSVCSHTGAIVLPGAVSIAGVRGAFDDGGRCTDAQVEEAVRGLARELRDFMREYVCPKHAMEAMVRGDGPPWTATV